MTDNTAILRGIFQTELADDTLELTPDTELADIPGWDSVNLSCVILGVETRFGLTLTPTEMDHLETFGDFLTIIKERSGV